MKEINVNSKYGIGEKIYTIWNRSIGFTCPICNGDGAILHKGYKVKCTYCYGSGNVFTHDKMWQVDKVLFRTLNDASFFTLNSAVSV